MGPPSEILPGLWLANFENAQDSGLLDKMGINRILTIGNRSPMDNSLLSQQTPGDPQIGENGILYKLVYAMDSTDQNILKHFRDCFDFIRNALASRHGVMVHCHMGFSRSAAVVIGYLMHSQRLTYDQAFGLVRKKRIVGPNSGFIRQLKLFEENEWNLNADYEDAFVLREC